jgi:D-serine deaminase-like pyridoxal phosphate-dependent protein
LSHPGSVETPIGVVDLDRATANAGRIAQYAATHGIGWRPHIKTHKSLRIASIQLAAGARGLTVATLREAEVMSTLTDDILLAYPQVGDAKLKRLLALPEQVDIKVAVDSAEAFLPMAGAFAASGRTVGVLVEEDVGMGRVGLASARAVAELAALVADTPGADFRGVLFYPGHIRMEEAEQDQHLALVSERVALTLDALRARSLDPEIVSGGSTPTMWKSHQIFGLTEIRSGSCIYFDREGLDIGVASLDDLAYTVLATVVSTAVPGRAVVDAGSKALAKESRGAGGFGILLDRPEVVVVGVSEEHGVLDIEHGNWEPQIGERVRIVPNHVCVSVNLQDRLLGCSGNEWTEVELEGRGRGTWKP